MARTAAPMAKPRTASVRQTRSMTKRYAPTIRRPSTLAYSYMFPHGTRPAASPSIRAAPNVTFEVVVKAPSLTAPPYSTRGRDRRTPRRTPLAAGGRSRRPGGASRRRRPRRPGPTPAAGSRPARAPAPPGPPLIVRRVGDEHDRPRRHQTALVADLDHRRPPVPLLEQLQALDRQRLVDADLARRRGTAVRTGHLDPGHEV